MEFKKNTQVKSLLIIDELQDKSQNFETETCTTDRECNTKSIKVIRADSYLKEPGILSISPTQLTFTRDLKNEKNRATEEEKHINVAIESMLNDIIMCEYASTGSHKNTQEKNMLKLLMRNDVVYLFEIPSEQYSKELQTAYQLIGKYCKQQFCTSSDVNLSEPAGKRASVVRVDKYLHSVGQLKVSATHLYFQPNDSDNKIDSAVEHNISDILALEYISLENKKEGSQTNILKILVSNNSLNLFEATSIEENANLIAIYNFLQKNKNNTKSCHDSNVSKQTTTKSGAKSIRINTKKIQSRNSCTLDISISSICTTRQLTQVIANCPGYAELWNWKLCYSLQKDGSSLVTFFENCKNTVQSILLVKDEQGHVFGAFVDTFWRNVPEYGGSVDCFVWHFDEQDKLCVYKSTGYNRFYAHSDYNGIIIGEGGTPALYINADFCLGRTTKCNTFASPPLTSDNFSIISFEVYGVE
ncbi:TLD family protein [Reticulomyxa filosa]|uniref:TLD family protein n=1 Tax=Reticulomyxa filosa TaxID=46433 RepID=X6MNL2_RETFI|nr:TLD family protein [Reticulomyxa filosa]|eukprot:ETO15017.1 TLD family protein [Reticulomyxa filosa]